MAQLHSRSVVSDRSIHPVLMRRSAQQSRKGSSMSSSPTYRGLWRFFETVSKRNRRVRASHDSRTNLVL